MDWTQRQDLFIDSYSNEKDPRVVYKLKSWRSKNLNHTITKNILKLTDVKMKIILEYKAELKAAIKENTS